MAAALTDINTVPQTQRQELEYLFDYHRIFDASDHFDSAASSANYNVRTATLVDPRVTPPVSWKRTKIRLFAGSNGTVPVPVTKTENVGVALTAIVLVVLVIGADRH